jgi:hypothetical protein
MWQGAVTSGNSITLPSRFATNEMPPGGGACPFAPQSVIFCLQRIAAAKE